ncbi:MAG: exo-alpha-sialidase [Clostridia bacterium]|nr:exo-alpha-sialidase [Clostridia bacterium]MBR3716022.1 exo-alpha-sialidase [Clostridia bacterium]
MKKIDAINSVVMENPDSVFGYFAWPSVTRLPDGRLAASSSGFRISHICPFGKAVISYSSDEGKTWSVPAPVIDTPLDDRDAGVTTLADKRVVFTSFNNRISMQRYHNNRSNKKLQNLVSAYLDSVDAESAEEKYLGSTYKVSHDGGVTFGELRRSPVTAPHGVCPLPSGGALYVGRIFDTEKEDSLACYRLCDDDSLEYLSHIENILIDGTPALSCEPHAIALTDKDILVQIRIHHSSVDAFTTYQCESSDGGLTWTKPHSIGLDHGSPPHIIKHSSGVLASVYGYRRPPFGQRVMFSIDGGKNWDKDYVLRDDGPSGDLGYPCSIELSDGKILTVYYQQKEEGGYCVIMQSIWEIPEEIIKKIKE